MNDHIERTDGQKFGRTFFAASVGLASMAASGVYGGVRGWQTGSKCCNLARTSVVINHEERSLIRRYTFSPQMKRHLGFALTNVLLGPTILLGRHVINNAFFAKKWGDCELPLTIFQDLVFLPIGCSAMAYSLAFSLVYPRRLILGGAAEVVRRLF